MQRNAEDVEAGGGRANPSGGKAGSSSGVCVRAAVAAQWLGANKKGVP